MTDYVLRDDISALGIRRLHVMRAEMEVEQGPYVERMQAEDGETVMVMLWKDELDNHHLYLAWRLNMNYPMWCWTIDGNLAEATAKAARRFLARFGKWPNRAHIRQAEGLPPGVELRDEQGEVLTRVDFAPLDNCWQANVVGVYYEEVEHGD